MVGASLLVLLSLATPSGSAEPEARRADYDCRLEDPSGAEHSWLEQTDNPFTVVAVLGTECPLARLYTKRLLEIAASLKGQEVGFVALMPNRQDSAEDVQAFVAREKIPFPVLLDPGCRVVDQIGATRTPEVFVLDRDRIVRYGGAIDDQYDVGVVRPKPVAEFLRDALADLRQGKAPRVAHSPPRGCLIGRVRPSAGEQQPATDVTFSRQIARILQARCQECHRPGQIGPFSMDDYREVAGWAEMIREVTRERRMPPWFANPAHGTFKNDARLTHEEIELIDRWVAAGAPAGDPAELPPKRAFVAGWRINPDKVVAMSEPFAVPAEGVVKYQYFVMDPGFTEEKWVKAAEVVAGNPAVVHHVIAFVLPPDYGTDRDSIMKAFESDFLTAMVPGGPPQIFPAGMAKRVPAGSRIVFQVHYTPNGVPQTDQSSCGLVFADPAEVRQEAYTRNVIDQFFEIPPGAANHQVKNQIRFRDDSLLIGMMPHMHLRGKSFRYVAHFPDGKDEILLDVPRYDFNWQLSYELPEPKFMPKGTRLECIAHFDNSSDNPNNPDPSKSVHFGDQTWEEMMIGFFQMARANQDLLEHPTASRMEQFRASASSGALVIDQPLAERAAAALRSAEDFARWWDLMAERLPQLDRMDVTLVSGLKLEWRAIAATDMMWQTVNHPALYEKFASAGPALGLYVYGIKRKPVVNQTLAGVKGVEMRMFGFLFGSSVHLPVRVGDQVGTINFWSQEKDAFPPEAVQFLQKAVDAATATPAANLGAQGTQTRRQ